jgi:hypothetical protein
VTPRNVSNKALQICCVELRDFSYGTLLYKFMKPSREDYRSGKEMWDANWLNFHHLTVLPTYMLIHCYKIRLGIPPTNNSMGEAILFGTEFCNIIYIHKDDVSSYLIVHCICVRQHHTQLLWNSKLPARSHWSSEVVCSRTVGGGNYCRQKKHIGRSRFQQCLAFQETSCFYDCPAKYKV